MEENKKEIYLPNPIAKASIKRKKHIIQGAILTSIGVLGLIIDIILAFTVFIKFEAQKADAISYSLILVFTFICIFGVIMIAGKFDKTIKADSHLLELITYYYGLDSRYSPLEGVNIDEISKLGFKDLKLVGFFDYFKATTASKIRFESSYIHEKNLDKETFKQTKLIEIRKYDTPETQEKSIDISSDGTIVYNGNAEKIESLNGTMIIFRNILNAPNTTIFIKDKDIHSLNLDYDNFEQVIFDDSRKKFSQRYEILASDANIANTYLVAKLLSSFVKVEKYFKKGLAFVYKNGHLYVFLNKYRMNLVKINEDRSLNVTMRDQLIKESLDAIGLISAILQLKGDYVSPYKDIYKSKEKVDFSKEIASTDDENFDETEDISTLHIE